MTADEHSNGTATAIATVVICQGSWCRLATASGQALRPKSLGQSSGYSTGPDKIDFRFANCLGLCGKGANAKIELRNPPSTADEAPTESVFLKNVHMLQDGDWVRIFKALRAKTPVCSVLDVQHHVPPIDPTARIEPGPSTGAGTQAAG